MNFYCNLEELRNNFCVLRKVILERNIEQYSLVYITNYKEEYFNCIEQPQIGGKLFFPEKKFYEQLPNLI